MDIKPLICCASPRSYPEFKKALNDLPYDKIVCKYYNEAMAYKLLKEYFLEHEKEKGYDYMCIIPDDLIVNKEGFELLLDDLKQEQYPALEGICNFSYWEREQFTCGPSLNGGPTFFARKQLEAEVEKQGSPIIKVESEGFACLFIRKDLLQNYPHIIKGMPNSSFDWGFSHTCYWEKIPIHVDTRVMFEHLAGRAGKRRLEYWGRGKEIARMYFYAGDGSLINKVRDEGVPAYLDIHAGLDQPLAQPAGLAPIKDRAHHWNW